MPTIQEVIAQYQRALDNQQIEATQRLLDSYQRAYGRLKNEQDALLKIIEGERAAGREPSQTEIRRMAEYKRLMANVKAEMDRYGAVIRDAAEGLQGNAATLGSQAAYGVTQTMLEGLPPAARASIMATFNRMPREAIAALVGALQEDSPLGRLLQTFGADTAKGVGDALISNIMAGHNPRIAAREMAGAWGVPLTRALRITRTEQLRAYRSATMAEYRQNPHIVRGWRWHADLSDRTCMSCLAQHGTLHGMDETLDDHPNGRCAAIPELPSMAELGFEGLELPNVVREGDGQRWFEGLTEAEQIGMMGKAKYDAWRGGQFEFGQLSKAVQDADWGRTFVEASLKELIGV